MQAAGSPGLAAQGIQGQSSEGLQQVKAAFSEAAAYIEAQGFKASALKDTFEYRLSGALCYSVAEGEYYVLYQDAAYRRVSNGDVSEAMAGGRIPEYASFTAACAAIDALGPQIDKPALFVTRGLDEPGDKGHACYRRRADAGSAAAADAYELTSAENAVNVYQLGYAGSGSVNPAISAFQGSNFHTLVFPQGRYLVTSSIWQKNDNRAFYGFDAELYTDSTFANSDGSITEGVLLSVRGNVVWGERQPDLENERYDAYYTTSHQEYNGLAFAKSAELSNPGWRNMVRVRNANDIMFSHCSFIDEGMDVLCFDLYGNYDGITFDTVTCKGNGDVQIRDLCDNVDRPFGLYGRPASSKGWIHKGTTGGGRNVTVRNCTFTMGNSVEEGLPIFAGNQQGLYYADGSEYAILKNCLVENVTLENNSWTMLEPTPEAIERRGVSRIVAFTCGYEDSPVRNIVVRDNTFDVFANYCFVQFGYVDGAELTGNTVRMWGDDKPDGDGKPGAWADVVERDKHSRVGPMANVRVHDNTFTLESNRTLTRLVDHYVKAGDFTFTNNEVNVEGKVTKLLDTAATCAGNTFNLHDLGSLYSNVRDVSENTYTIDKLGSLFEGNGVNAGADIVIASERATIQEVPNHLMGFFGSGTYTPRFNGHALTFLQCDYEIESAPERYRRIAYDPSDIADGVVLTFWDCTIPGFDTSPYNTIENNELGKVKLRFMSGDATGGFLLQSVEAYREDGGFDDIVASTTFEPLAADVFGADVGQLTGEVIGGFVLSGDEGLADADVTVAVTPATAASDDVLALYKQDGASWDLATYAEVVGGEFTFETTGFGAGTYAVVDKARGMGDAVDMPLGSSEDKNNLRNAWSTGGVFEAQRDLSISELWASADTAIEQTELRSTMMRGTATGAGINMQTDAAAAPVHLYFRGCTFDCETFSIARPGIYVFDCCEFVNSPKTSITASGKGVHIFVFNSTMHDNNPPLDEFNANESSVRYWKYAALSFQVDDASIHACRTAISGYQTNPTVLVTSGREGDALFFEHCTMERCGGCGISMNSPVRGRIDDNRFEGIGALRGEGGYAASSDSRWGYPSGVGEGRGVGGNAVYGSTMSYHMRVRGNVVTDVMENGIEGYYWCVDDNYISTTGCRFDEGFDTMSTEAIWGASIYVRNNRIKKPHGSGIIVNASHRPYDIPFDIVVSGNTVEKNSYGLMDDTDGIRVAPGGLFEEKGHVVTVSNNTVTGFRRAHLNLGTHDNVTYENNKETLPALKIDSIETQSGDNDFTQIISLVNQEREELLGVGNLGNPTGASVAAFKLAVKNASTTFDYAEVHVACDADLAKDGDIVALYRTGANVWNWKCYGYYPVVNGGFTFELGSDADLGKFDIVNKSQQGNIVFADLSTLEGSSHSARFSKALQEGGAYTSSTPVSTARRYMNNTGQYATRLEFRDLDFSCTDSTENNGFTFAKDDGCDFYFENCTFDHLDVRFFVSGVFAFVNCTFKNYPYTAIAAISDDARVYVYGCTFENNAPDVNEWNSSSKRHFNYAAIRMGGTMSGKHYGENMTLHVADSAFSNLQTDSTVIVSRKGDDDYGNVTVCFERSAMTDCGGAGLVLDNKVSGRVDGNTFTNIGAMRGMNGYRSTIHDTLGERGYDEAGHEIGLPGAGVGGNAVFGRGRNTQMRVRGNTCTNLMENGIEGTYYCISGNCIDTTGYRYDDPTGDSYNGGYKTVSTEGIAAAGTWYVTDNTVLNVHGRGIGVSHWNNHLVEVSGNTVTRRGDGNRDYDTSEGIKVRTDENSWANVTVRDNTLSGFENNYRVLHANDADKTRTCENVVIDDPNDGRVMGPVYSNLRGVKLTTVRDSGLSLSAEAEQIFDLPGSLCVVCVELKVKSSTGAVNVGIATADSSYNSSITLHRIASDDYTTAYACFKAVGSTRVRLSAADSGQLDIEGVNGWYEVEPGALPYKLTYDLAGGLLATGANPSSYTSEDEVSLASPTRAGFTFAGWTGTGLAEPTVAVDIPYGSIGDRCFKATWSPNPVKPDFPSEGGTGPSNADSSDVSDGFGRANVPAASGTSNDDGAGVGDGVDAFVEGGGKGDGTGSAESSKNVAAKTGKVSLTVDVGAHNTATVKSAKKAAGSVSLDTLKTADGRTLKVIAIADNAFASSNVTKVTIGPNVRTVGKGAFKNCKKLKSFTVGKNVKTIKKNALSGCKKLKVLVVKTAKLNKSSLRNLLRGSKVKTVKLTGLPKKQKMKVSAKYAKWLPKGVSLKLR